MKNKFIYVALFSLLFALTGCSSKKDDTVNIGYFNNVTHAQALYLKSIGSLEKALGDNYSVNWTAFNAGPAEVEALFSGSIDIGYIGPVPAISANVKSKGDVVVISSATKAGAVLVTSPNANINSIADLAGKTIAVPQIGNTQYLCLLALLEENNLADTNNGGDITISAVANADVSNLMNAGSIDAALVPEPWGSVLEKQGANVLLDANEIFHNGNYDVAVVVVRKDFLNEHKDLVLTFLEAHELATEAININTEESSKIINEELDSATGKSLDSDIITKAFSRITFSTENNIPSILEMGEISKAQELIPFAPTESVLFIKVK